MPQAQCRLRLWLRQSSRLVLHAPLALMPPMLGNFPSGLVPLVDAGRVILGGLFQKLDFTVIEPALLKQCVPHLHRIC